MNERNRDFSGCWLAYLSIRHITDYPERNVALCRNKNYCYLNRVKLWTFLVPVLGAPQLYFEMLVILLHQDTIKLIAPSACRSCKIQHYRLMILIIFYHYIPVKNVFILANDVWETPGWRTDWLYHAPHLHNYKINTAFGNYMPYKLFVRVLRSLGFNVAMLLSLSFQKYILFVSTHNDACTIYI